MGKIFNKKLIASLNSKDTVFKKIRDCILRNDKSRLKQFSPYLQSSWRDLYVSSGYDCMDEKVTIPHAPKDRLMEIAHPSRPASWEMVCMAKNGGGST